MHGGSLIGSGRRKGAFVPPEAVIFDMDGVIADTADAHCASWQQLGAARGVTITREDFLATFGRPSEEIIRLRFGADLPDEEVRRLAREKEAVYRSLARHTVRPIPHALELIRDLHALGVRLAVGSSAPPENIAQILDLFALRACFAVTVSGHDVSRGKPDPEVFVLAAERLGVRPERCVVIEDAVAGIEAARAAGMTAIALTSSHPRAAFRAADRVVDSLAELRGDGLLGLEA